MSKYYDSLKLNEKGYGPLKFTKRGFDTQKRGAALLGRAIALYDFIMDYKTDLRILSDVKARINKFRDICIWVDTLDTKRPKNAYSAICRDYPGKGIEQVADPDIDIGDVQQWYEWEYKALEVVRDFLQTTGILFRWDIQNVADALKIPFKVVNLFYSYSELPGDDLASVFEYAVEFTHAMPEWHMIVKTFSEDNYDEHLIAPYRQLFIERWQKAEDKLISVPVRERKGVRIYG